MLAPYWRMVIDDIGRFVQGGECSTCSCEKRFCCLLGAFKHFGDISKRQVIDVTQD